MPDIREGERDAVISKYLQDIQTIKSEPARSQRFGMLLHSLFAFIPSFIEEFVQGIEKYLKVPQKDRILKGRADNLFGNVVIEFEADLTKTRTEAEEQLRRYLAILWSQEIPSSRTPFLCIATDGVSFVSYTPTLDEPQVSEVQPEGVHLNILESVDWRKLPPVDIFFWLDRYFLRREVYHPTSERMEADFGVKSHAFQTANAALLALWRQVKARGSFAVVYDTWDKYLGIVYGTEVGAEELFIRHTFLATLAKLLAWMRLTGNPSLPEDEQITRMLEGRLFKDLGINNFLEEDFFSWVSRSQALPVALHILRGLFSILQRYNLRELSEDVLKSLYQELVDPETRHDLGEFYTPDWLARRMINQLLADRPEGSLFDPTCGSGTFLYQAIKEKKRLLGESRETLGHILEAVCGADIHPLAVIIAKTNYLLALGDLLKKRGGQMSIPVFLADTNFLPQREIEASRKLWRTLPGYKVVLDARDFHLPDILLEDLDTYDRAIELAKDFAWQNRGKNLGVSAFRNFLQAQRFPGWENHDLLSALLDIATKMKSSMEDDRDTIWAYILKNIYKPLFFKDRFDFIIGNPPWISFRYLEPAYQEKMKTRIIREYRLLSGRGELITHLEIGTLFLLRSADLYLKPGGLIAFVLPRSLFTADQHHDLRLGTFKFSPDIKYKLYWRELWDCDQVFPLFNVPACVLWGEKLSAAEKSRESFPGLILEGKLPRKNASLEEAEKSLIFTETEFSLHRRGRRTFWAPGPGTMTKEASPYKKKFFQGATIVPRSFWFVRIKPSPLGFDPNMPPIETDPRAIKEAKKPYQEVKFSGNVESRFLYATLLSTDLLPFGHLDYRLVVLPLEPKGRKMQLLTIKTATEKGFSKLSEWLKKAEDKWKELRKEKADLMTIYDRIDRYHGLIRQSPKTKYRVIYNTSGTLLAAAVIKSQEIKFEINGQEIEAENYLVDHVTYSLDSSVLNEANYICSILNTSIIDKLVKPLQARGLWGPRHIHKKVLEIPIPLFEETNPQHLSLASLGRNCTEKVSAWLAAGGPGQVKSIGRLRQIVRQLLKEELQEIDALVVQILK